MRHKLYITRWLDSQSSGCDAAARHLGGKQLLSVHGQCPTATVFLAQRVQGGSQHGDGWTVRTLRLRVRIHKWLFPHTKRYRIALKEIANVDHTKKTTTYLTKSTVKILKKNNWGIIVGFMRAGSRSLGDILLCT